MLEGNSTDPSYKPVMYPVQVVENHLYFSWQANPC